MTGINRMLRIRLICGQMPLLRLTLERHEAITERKRDFVKFKQFGVGLYQVVILSVLFHKAMHTISSRRGVVPH